MYGLHDKAHHAMTKGFYRSAFAGMTVFLIIFAVATASPALAQDKETKTVIGNLQKSYEKLDSFEASFVQRLTNSANGKVETRHGSIVFKQPRLIRWETLTPEAELLIVGPQEVWDYVPAEKTAYKYGVADVLRSKTMLRFLSGQARLDQDFEVTKVDDPAARGLIVLDLIPMEPEPGMVQAHLWLDPKTYLLHKLLLIDFYGNENELELSDVKLGNKPALSLFEFTPPAGVEVKEHKDNGA